MMMMFMSAEPRGQHWEFATHIQIQGKETQLLDYICRDRRAKLMLEMDPSCDVM
jgi:hypothetical protein